MRPHSFNFACSNLYIIYISILQDLKAEPDLLVEIIKLSATRGIQPVLSGAVLGQAAPPPAVLQGPQAPGLFGAGAEWTARR